jgi:hypothetical protein
MDFGQTLPSVVSAFQRSNLHFALIGGLAISFHGIQRSTLDADFILLMDDLEAAHTILLKLGYNREFHSENVSHYLSQNPALGRIDILHALRPIAEGMISRAKQFPLTPEHTIPVADIEDIIGLKIQAACNDPSRHRSDWNDIHSLIEHSAQNSLQLDWLRLADYLDLFDLGETLPDLRLTYASALKQGT